MDGSPPTIAAHGGLGAGDQSKYPERKLAPPTDFLKRGNEMTQTYDQTDDVTDEQFDAALADAREEGNVRSY